MANTNRDAINSAMGGSQDAKQDDYQNTAGGVQADLPIPPFAPSLLIKPGVGTNPSQYDPQFPGGSGSFYAKFNGVEMEKTNFAGVLDFSRESVATYTDGAGVLQTAASGAPRLDWRFTGSLWVLGGLLIEAQATNLLLQSAALATQNVAVASGTYTLSFYGAGTVTLSGASTAGPLVGVASPGRAMLTFTATAGTLTLTVSGTVNFAQLEIRSAATSYIPTSGAQATRGADVFTKPLGVEFNPNAQTALFRMRFNRPGADGTGGKVIYAWSDGSVSNRVVVQVSSTGLIQLVAVVAGVVVSQISGPAVLADTDYRIAIGFSAGIARLVVNGTVYADVSLPSIPPGLSVRGVGSSSGAPQPNAWIMPYLTRGGDESTAATEFTRLLTAAEMMAYTA